MTRLALCLALALCAAGCSGTREVDRNGCAMPKGYKPATRRANDGYDYYRVRIDETGGISWNGMSIDRRMLRNYATQYSAMPEAGRLSLQVHDKAPCEAVLFARKALVDAQLCAQGRCAEADWALSDSVVY